MLRKKQRVQKGIIAIPLSIFETAETKEDLEDWLMSQNKEFIEKLFDARREDLADL